MVLIWLTLKKLVVSSRRWDISLIMKNFAEKIPKEANMQVPESYITLNYKMQINHSS